MVLLRQLYLILQVCKLLYFVVDPWPVVMKACGDVSHERIWNECSDNMSWLNSVQFFCIISIEMIYRW